MSLSAVSSLTSCAQKVTLIKVYSKVAPINQRLFTTTNYETINLPWKVASAKMLAPFLQSIHLSFVCCFSRNYNLFAGQTETFLFARQRLLQLSANALWLLINWYISRSVRLIPFGSMKSINLPPLPLLRCCQQRTANCCCLDQLSNQWPTRAKQVDIARDTINFSTVHNGPVTESALQFVTAKRTDCYQSIWSQLRFEGSQNAC